MDDLKAEIDTHIGTLIEALNAAPESEREWIYDHYLMRVAEAAGALGADPSGPGGPASLADVARRCWATLPETHGRELLGMPSGFAQLDALLNGWRGLALLGAEPNIGKTTFMFNVGSGIVERDIEAIFVMFSFEMPVDEIYWRAASARSGLPYHVVRQGSTHNGKRREIDKRLGHAWSADDAGAAERARSAFEVDPHYRRIFVFGPESVGAMSLRAPVGRGAPYPLWPMERIVRECMRKAEASRAFIGIDYLQRIPIDQSAARSDLDRDERTMEAVHTFARRMNHPVLAIAEFRKDDIERASLGSKTSGMAAFAGSRRLAYSADTLISMRSPTSEVDQSAKVREGYKIIRREVDVDVIKVRDGGRRGSVKMYFEIESSMFRERDKDQ